MSKQKYLGPAVIVTALAMATAHGYLLQNSFFDTTIDFDDGIGWEGFSNPGGGDAVGQHDWASGSPGVDGAWGTEDDDNLGLAFQAWGSDGGGFYQTVPGVEAGENYNLEIWSHCGCNSPGGDNYPSNAVFNIDFEWYDGDPNTGGSLVSTSANVPNMTDGGCDGDPFDDYTIPFNWQEHQLVGTAPSGATHLRVVVKWDGDGAFATGGASEAVRWDNALLTTDTLDPTNTSTEPTDELFIIRYGPTESNVHYTVESSEDVLSYEQVPYIAVVESSGVTTQQFYDLPGTPVHSWRASGEKQGR